MKKLMLKFMRYLRDNCPNFWDDYVVNKGKKGVMVCNFWDWCANRR
jgi:hypothetical protein